MILVIGEVCVDHYIYCSVARLCPEAPVPVAVPLKTHKTFGMAKNVVANLKSLGEQRVDLLSPVEIMIKKRFVDEQSGYILLRVDENDKVNMPLSKEAFNDRFNTLGGENIKAVVISDYNKGFLSEEVLSYIGEVCRSSKIPTFIDTKKFFAFWSQKFDFIKINNKEYKMQLEKNSNCLHYCNDLIVTKGGNGSSWVNAGVDCPVEEVHVSDVSGCGDSYLAGFVNNYLENKSVKAAMAYANKVARIAASKHGVVAVNKSEVL